MASQIEGQTTQSMGIQNLRVGTLDLDGTLITASATEINAAADGSTNYVAVAVGSTAIDITAAQTGKKFLIPDMTAACTFDLPAEAAGLTYTFVYVGGAEDAHGIILDSESDTNFFVGGVNHLDADGETQLAVFSDGDSNSKLTCSTITAGTEFTVICNGTTWYIFGQVCGATAPVFADQ
jgi:hypothetical protein